MDNSRAPPDVQDAWVRAGGPQVRRRSAHGGPARSPQHATTPTKPIIDSELGSSSTLASNVTNTPRRPSSSASTLSVTTVAATTPVRSRSQLHRRASTGASWRAAGKPAASATAVVAVTSRPARQESSCYDTQPKQVAAQLTIRGSLVLTEQQRHGSSRSLVGERRRGTNGGSGSIVVHDEDQLPLSLLVDTVAVPGAVYAHRRLGSAKSALTHDGDAASARPAKAVSASVPRLSVIRDEDGITEAVDEKKDIRRSRSRDASSGGGAGYGKGANGGCRTKGLGHVAAALLRAGVRAAAVMEGSWQKRR